VSVGSSCFRPFSPSEPWSEASSRGNLQLQQAPRRQPLLTGARPRKVRDIAIMMSIRSTVLAARAGTEAGQTMVSVAGALIIFDNSLLRLPVGLDECASYKQPAMARRGCFINIERRRGAPPFNVQHPLSRRFSLLEPLALLQVLYYLSNLILANGGASRAADEVTVRQFPDESTIGSGRHATQFPAAARPRVCTAGASGHCCWCFIT
jgi:hypothetical protein